MKMVFIVDSHPRYTLDSVLKVITDQLAKYDKYDKANDCDAQQLLFNSINPSLNSRLQNKI